MDSKGSDSGGEGAAAGRHAELGHKVLEAAPVVILLLDGNGLIQYVNPYFERLTGYRLDEVQGKDWFDTFLPGRDHERIRALFRQSYAGQQVRGNVNPIVTRTGEERDIEWIDERLRDADGNPTGLLAIGHDVTAKQAAQHALRTSEQRLAEAHRIASIGAWEYDLRTGANWWSPEQYRIHGVPVGTLVTQQTFLDLVHPDDRAMFDQSFRSALVAGAAELEYRIIRPDGEVRDLHGRASTTNDAQGQPVTMTGTNQDITDRKRADAQLHASAVAQQRLVEELREANRRKNDFIALLSHELRNPLSAIRSGVFVLNHFEAPDERAQRATNMIERQVTHLARLVDDLLDVSRIALNKIQLQRARVDLDQLVSTLVDDLRSAFANQGVRLEVTLAGKPLIVNGDAVRLAQAIDNLLHNAIKFTPSGGLTTVSLTEDATRERAVLRVADTGTGIDPAMIDELFQPFAQADRTLARSMGGLGLGLALVKGLVELHGGDVSARSEGAGSGAEFVVHLPLDRSQQRTEPAASEAVSAARRVLIIEDNVDAAEALRIILELDGHQVEVAHDGPAGIRIARDHQPDVVLCDIGLPGVSGYDVARELKRDGSMRSTQLVALSGYATPEDVERALAAGFNLHLAKPIAPDRLRRVVGNAR